MLHVSFRRVRDGQLDRLRAWMDELMRRQDEVRQTFDQEGVRHERAYLIEDRQGFVLVYAIELEDEAKAYEAYARSTLPIDLEHRRTLGEVLSGPAEAEWLYDLRR